MTERLDGVRVSVLTPRGTGAMAVIRISGREGPSMVRRCFVPRRAGALGEAGPGDLVYGRFVDGDETVDEGIVARLADGLDGPVLDLTVHGGLRVVERVLRVLQKRGATVVRAADMVDAGASASRIEADVLSALSCAETRRCVRFLAAQRRILPGELECIADLCDRDAPAGRARLSELLARSERARYLVEGATVAVVGPVNAGKSTLLNALFAQSRSLVSHQPGTTRDWVDVRAALKGVPIRAADTAGLRPEADAVEREGMIRGLAVVQRADVQIVVVDGSAACPAGLFEAWRGVIDRRRAVLAINKSDLPQARPAARLEGGFDMIVRTSGLHGDGLEELTEAVMTILAIESVDADQPALFTTRQIKRVRRAMSAESGCDLGRSLRYAFVRTFSARDGRA